MSSVGDRERMRPQRYLAPDYYTALAASHDRSPFLSPVQDARFVERATRFLLDGESGQVAEVGPGYGELIGRLGARVARDAHVWAVDACPEFLARARAAWTGLPQQLSTVCADLEAGAPGVLDRRLDRIVAVNVLQDVDLARGLRTLRRWLSAGGQLLVTVLAKETMDELYAAHPLYDPQTGCYYKPSSSGLVLGRREAAGGAIAYERILRFRELGTIRAAFRAAGLELREERQLCFAAEAMIARWRAAGTLDGLSPEGLVRLRASGRYVDAYELVATCRA